jgi:hypothetical protein
MHARQAEMIARPLGPGSFAPSVTINAGGKAYPGHRKDCSQGQGFREIMHSTDEVIMQLVNRVDAMKKISRTLAALLRAATLTVVFIATLQTCPARAESVATRTSAQLEQLVAPIALIQIRSCHKC